MATRQSKRDRREAAQRASRRKRLIRGGPLVVFLLAATGIIVFSAGSQESATALAPDFTLETPTGEEVKLSDYRGRPVALTFMHTY